MYIPDETDWKIINLLNQDGRMPSTEIAEILGDISARTVNNRIKALTKEGIVNIRAVIDPEKVGYGVLADVYIEVETGLVREVANQVANFPEVSYVACATGDVDVSLSVRAQTIRELFDFVDLQLGIIPGVRRTNTHILPIKIKDLDTWFPPKAMKTIDDDNKLPQNGKA
ncbi:MAG: Lrp/AsnC family transcriptional regulator [Chloroflexi bacterium]|nr:Lrp/AsnC family transcriptional regulator [Chloroflexota bacterium]